MNNNRNKLKIAMMMFVWCVISMVNCTGVKAATIADEFEYELINNNSEVKITDYSGLDTEVVIPDEIDGKKVTYIGEWSFYNCDNLISIVIPDGVTKIERGAFRGCDSLTSIAIPDSVTSIGCRVFSGTKWLEDKQKENPIVIVNDILVDGRECTGDVIVPDGVTEIAEDAFSGDPAGVVDNNSSLTSVVIPDSVIRIGDSAFSDCKSLTSVNIAYGLKRIEDWAFYGCSNLTSISIPDSVTFMGYNIFQCCYNLQSVKLSKNVTRIPSNIFNACGLINIEIPEGITVIENGAFGGTELTSVKIPESVTSIEYFAFSNCFKLKNVTIMNKNAVIDDNNFLSKDVILCGYAGSTAEAYAKNHNLQFQVLGSTETDNTINTGNDKTNKTTDTTTNVQQTPVVPTNQNPQPTPVSKGTVLTCETQKCQVVVTSTDSKQPEAAYIGTTNKKATKIIIPDEVVVNGISYKVTSVRKKALKNNKKVKTVILGKNVTNVEKEAFSGCKNLSKITIKGSNLKSVGKNAIKGISKKAVIQCPKKKVNTYKKLFKSNTGFKKSMRIKK